MEWILGSGIGFDGSTIVGKEVKSKLAFQQINSQIFGWYYILGSEEGWLWGESFNSKLTQRKGIKNGSNISRKVRNIRTKEDM